jgi:hypothetical protein
MDKLLRASAVHVGCHVQLSVIASENGALQSRNRTARAAKLAEAPAVLPGFGRFNFAIVSVQFQDPRRPMRDESRAFLAQRDRSADSLIVNQDAAAGAPASSSTMSPRTPMTDRDIDLAHPLARTRRWIAIKRNVPRAFTNPVNEGQLRHSGAWVHSTDSKHRSRSNGA